MRLVLNNVDEKYKDVFLELAKALKVSVTIEEKEEKLPQFVVDGIKKSQEQAEQGKLTPHNEVMSKYLNL